MSKINLYYHTGSANHGCEAIVRGSQKILEKSALALFSFAPDEEKKYGVDKVVNVETDIKKDFPKFGFRHILSSLQYKIFQKTSLATKFRRAHFFSKIKKNDICLSIGGDNYTYKGIWELADYNELLHKKGAKTVLWGCSIDEELIPNLVEDLNRYDMIIARETMTYEALLKNNIKTVIRLCPDSAFQLETGRVSLPKFFQKGNTVGINLSPLILKYGNGELILRNFENLISYIIENTNLQIALIPHVAIKNNDDKLVMMPLYEKFNNSERVLILDDTNCIDLKGFISNCRFFIGARTHATIAAYSNEIPTIVAGYSMKAKGIAKDIFGTHENYVCPVQDITQEFELVNSFKWLQDNEQKILEHYRNMMPNYKENAKKAADFLNEIK